MCVSWAQGGGWGWRGTLQTPTHVVMYSPPHGHTHRRARHHAHSNHGPSPAVSLVGHHRPMRAAVPPEAAVLYPPPHPPGPPNRKNNPPPTLGPLSGPLKVLRAASVQDVLFEDFQDINGPVQVPAPMHHATARWGSGVIPRRTHGQQARMCPPPFPLPPPQPPREGLTYRFTLRPHAPHAKTRALVCCILVSHPLHILLVRYYPARGGEKGVRKGGGG